MLPIEKAEAVEFSSYFNDSRTVKKFEGNLQVPFELKARRTFTPDYEKYPDLPQEEAMLQFEKEFPFGKMLASESEEGFQEVLRWSEFSFLEQHYVPVPKSLEYVRVISSTLKATLQQFCLPPHAFYPVQVKHEITEEVRPYFVFHLLCDVWWARSTALWSEMIPLIVNEKTKELVKTYPKGAAGSADRFVEEVLPFLRENRAFNIKFEQYVYEQPFDIIPAGNSLIISNELAAHLNEVGLPMVVGEKYIETTFVSGFAQ